MTQDEYLAMLSDQAGYTVAQREAVVHYLGGKGNVIDALKPPKGTPTAERYSYVEGKGRRLLNALDDFAAAGAPTAAEAMAFLRADLDADWTGLDDLSSGVDFRHDTRERETDRAADSDMRALEGR